MMCSFCFLAFELLKRVLYYIFFCNLFFALNITFMRFFHTNACISGFLSLDTVDTLDWIIVCCRGLSGALLPHVGA